MNPAAFLSPVSCFLSPGSSPHEQTSLSRQIEATDSAIDREVYTLYGLTEDEVRLVEQ